jgi:serine/threonine-protein phosphatase 6 regulatory ankyrin repeat subunit B
MSSGITCFSPTGSHSMQVHRFLRHASILTGFLLLAGLVFGLGSCRIVQPLQKSGPGARAPEMMKPGNFLDAAARGDLVAVRELAGADPAVLEATDASGWDALHYAAWNAHPQVYEYLLQQGAEGNLFTEAALGPWQSFLQRLATNPIAIDSRDPKQKATALIWAVRTGNQAGCEVLLSRGADLFVRDRDGNSVVHHAASMGRLELLESLLSAGADVNAANDRGQTALHLAASAGSFETCQLLLDRGASLEAVDADGNTPLHLAARGGSFEICEYFLFFGAQVGLENGEGLTARDMAARQGHERIVRLLEAQSR